MTVAVAALVFSYTKLVPTVPATDIGERPDPYQYEYSQLRDMFDAERPGLADDGTAGTTVDRPALYARILSAEALTYTRHPSDDSKARIRNAVDWLLAHSSAADGTPGWGIGFAWDAFRDGSVNPADQPYTVSTAFVIEGLLDALDVEDALNENRRAAVKRRVRTVIDHYLTHVFTTLTDDTGFFPYSTNPNDHYFTPNVSSAFVGVAARYFGAFRGDIKRPDFYRKRLKAAIAGLLDQVQYSNGTPFWRYVALPNDLGHDQPNDLFHHALIMWGITSYEDVFGDVDIPWHPDQALASMQAFWVDGQLRRFPHNVFSDRSRVTLPSADLYGAGMSMALYARWGEHRLAEDTVSQVRERLGPWPRLRKNARDEAGSFAAGPAADVLWGLAQMRRSAGLDDGAPHRALG